MGATCAPPPNSPPWSPSKQQEVGTEEATRTKTPPPIAAPTLEAPPPSSKDAGMTATLLPYTTTSERYETNKHNILVTFPTHEMVITFVSMFARATNTLQINLFPKAEDCPSHYELGKFLLPKA